MPTATNTPPAAWQDEPIYRSVIAMAEELERQGYSADDISDAFLGVGLHIAENVATRLLLVAERFAAEAAKTSSARRAGAAGPAN